ncbi:MAG: ATP-binding protein [Bacteroidota bacterium]|nr:ATP-binding protein [Bacteroidota bacterium]
MENIKEEDIIITLLVGTFVLFLMTAVIVYSVIQYQKKVLNQKEKLRSVEKKYQNDLLDATIVASEMERQSVAKNLHDDIGALINVIKLNNNKLKNIVESESPEQKLIETNNKLLLEINKNVNSISNDLMSPTLKTLGFIRALDQLTLQIHDSNSVNIVFNPNELKIRLNDKIETQLYRICKEVLNNILKHSRASDIFIKLEITQESLTIIIKYNGTGINDDQVKIIMENNKGLGLKSIYSRAQILNGKINYFSQKNDASVLIQVPIK